MHTAHFISPELVYADDDLLVINKPSGWLSIPDRHDAALSSIKSWLESRYEKVFVVHRIDRDTSGLMMFARNAEAHKYYNTLFEKRALKKSYYGLVSGILEKAEGDFDQPIQEHPSIAGKMIVGRKGKPSLTHYTVEERFRNFTWMRFEIETGRTHQIRVHLSNAGHPIICDPLYGSPDPVLLSTFKKKFKLSKSDDQERPLVSRLALHAYSVAVVDREGTQREFTAPLSRDLDTALKQMRKWASL